MGWTSFNYRKETHSTFNVEALKELLKDEFREYNFAKFHLHKDNYHHEGYTIMQKADGTSKPFILVILIKINGGEIFYKEMTEDMGPNYYNCPIDFFKWVPTTNEYSIEFRRQCNLQTV